MNTRDGLGGTPLRRAAATWSAVSVASAAARDVGRDHQDHGPASNTLCRPANAWQSAQPRVAYKCWPWPAGGSSARTSAGSLTDRCAPWPGRPDPGPGGDRQRQNSTAQSARQPLKILRIEFPLGLCAVSRTAGSARDRNHEPAHVPPSSNRHGAAGLPWPLEERDAQESRLGITTSSRTGTGAWASSTRATRPLAGSWPQGASAAMAHDKVFVERFLREARAWPRQRFQIIQITSSARMKSRRLRHGVRDGESLSNASSVTPG